MFPSLRGEIDWWKNRSRSPLLFPKKYARISGVLERKSKLSKVSNGGERREKTSSKGILPVGEEAPLYRDSKSDRFPCFRDPKRYYRLLERYYRLTVLPGRVPVQIPLKNAPHGIRAVPDRYRTGTTAWGNIKKTRYENFNIF